MRQTATMPDHQRPPGPPRKKLQTMRRLAADYTGLIAHLVREGVRGAAA